MSLSGVVLVVLLSVWFDFHSHKLTMEKALNNLRDISEEVALHIDSNLEEKANIALTISSGPLIKDALLQSNSDFAALPDKKRKQKIDSLNQRWMKTVDINDPFIQAHMTNFVAEYFKAQQIIMPGMYGEIFLTNRYGAMISTTGKLTTLAHAHKYWWIACYNDGQGRIFLDDRGFEASAKGYVLGVVIPIKEGKEIIGILKCNVNITGPLTDVVHEFGLRHLGQMKIVRTGGLIVSEHGVVPLSTKVDEELVGLLRQKKIGSAIIHENPDHDKPFFGEQHEGDRLVAFSPIRKTMGSDKFGFGSCLESIEHIKRNMCEGWHVVVSIGEEDFVKTAHETTRLIIFIGVFFTISNAFLALLLGKWAAKPIVELATTARAIGAGNLHSRANVDSRDEIGSLAQTLNNMAENLQKTMASRNELIKEVEQRIKAEKKLQLLATTDELTGAYNRRAFDDSMHKNIGRAKRYNENLSLFLIDIDDFKKVNDTYGHDVGDMVLITIVRIVTDTIRQEDTIARWGGEEFTVLMPQTEKANALQLAERVREKIYGYDFHKVGHVTISIGLTQFQADDTVDSFVKRADNALYKAKKDGKNMVIYC